MNETMNTILTRRSIRKFTDEPISEEILEAVAEAAMHAPSGMCRKTWQFTVVSNSEIIKRLVKAVGEAVGRTEYDMYAPTALVIPSNDRENAFGREDNACALQNIFLAAKSYGVGSVWINQLNGNSDGDDIRAILREIGVPDDHVVYGIAALGYADENSPRPMYREVGVVKFIK